MDLKLLPRPRRLDMRGGTFPAGGSGEIRFGSNAGALPGIVTREWREETGGQLSAKQVEGGEYFFSMGEEGPRPQVADSDPEAYCLEVRTCELAASANTYRGLLYAWQTLKQLLRHGAEEIPCLKIDDWPDLPWRVYHLDMKATRRRLSNLHDILPRLSELKVNAVLAEYEDYIQLERHPEFAVPGALSKDEIRPWIKAAADYGIAVIPLVQTLGHWQYILGRPEYAHLQEKPGDTTSGCPSQPGTWTLASDFLDEMMELHPDAPFIHVGLDEVFHLGACKLCRDALKGRSPDHLFTDWLDRICARVLDRGFTPMAWGDMVKLLDKDMGKRLNREAVYSDWGYTHDGGDHTSVRLHYKDHVSRQWLLRPEGRPPGVTPLYFTPDSGIFEDLPEDERSRMHPLLDTDGYPRRLKMGFQLAWLKQLGLKRAIVTGIRVSYHGCIAPLFFHGQMNTRAGAEGCREHGARVLIGSSWARGHSFARINAHPELDWYGIATLGDSGWAPLGEDEMRDFDARFAFQFFGLEDGHIGDLYYLFERSGPRAHDVMDDYTGYIEDECGTMLPKVKRNMELFRLFAEIAGLQALRFRCQRTLLEMEYFYETWSRVPEQFKAGMLERIADVEAETDRQMSRLGELYKETLIDADAEELAASQLRFWKDNMLAMKDRLWG